MREQPERRRPRSSPSGSRSSRSAIGRSCSDLASCPAERNAAELPHVPVRPRAPCHPRDVTHRRPLILASTTTILFGLHQLDPVWPESATMPIFLWELSLGLWLIVKGFKPATITADAPLRPNSNVSAFVGDENNPCACAPRSGGAAVTGAQREHLPRVHLEGPADACNQMRCGNGAN